MMRCAATWKHLLESSVNLGVGQPFLCWPTTWSGSGTDELHRYGRRRPRPVLLLRGSSAMSLRGPVPTAASTDCLAEVEISSERGRFFARSAHARRKPSGYSNTRFAIHPLRPGTGRAPLAERRASMSAGRIRRRDHQGILPFLRVLRVFRGSALLSAWPQILCNPSFVLL